MSIGPFWYSEDAEWDDFRMKMRKARSIRIPRYTGSCRLSGGAVKSFRVGTYKRGRAPWLGQRGAFLRPGSISRTRGAQRPSRSGQERFQVLKWKFRKPSTVKGCLAHSVRHTYQPHEDRARMDLSYRLRGQKHLEDVYTEHLEHLKKVKRKIQANATTMVEVIVSASPEQMARMTREERRDYFEKAVQWFEQRSAPENIRYAVVHSDESSEHMHLFFEPMVFKWDEKMKEERWALNTRNVFGNRNSWRKIHSDFAKEVSNEFGIERGVEGRKIRALELRRWYAEFGATMKRYEAMVDSIAKDNLSSREKEAELRVLDEELKKRFEELRLQAELIAEDRHKLTVAKKALEKSEAELAQKVTRRLQELGTMETNLRMRETALAQREADADENARRYLAKLEREKERQLKKDEDDLGY